MNERLSVSSFDEQLTAISNLERRRLLLALLNATRNGGLPLDAGAIESDIDERRRRIQLTHVHLPKLVSGGYVDQPRKGSPDRQRLLVTDGPRFDEIRPLLELLEANRGLLPEDWK
ncbi:hypothetical protein [Halobellus litoreus]|uniref:ArsR family transcriptional regulator n=1 Tax=Halobellus litoreus TaxID=755310 RepID=A0ABD6DV96_9EURY|nr:hypothetical protein [Halobellus litoreus]